MTVNNIIIVINENQQNCDWMLVAMWQVDSHPGIHCSNTHRKLDKKTQQNGAYGVGDAVSGADCTKVALEIVYKLCMVALHTYYYYIKQHGWIVLQISLSKVTGQSCVCF